MKNLRNSVQLIGRLGQDPKVKELIRTNRELKDEITRLGKILN